MITSGRTLVLPMVLIVLGSALHIAAQAEGEEVISWSYEEAWWDIYEGPNSQYETQENGYITVTDAGMTLALRSVVEVNPSSNQHGVNQSLTIFDKETDEVVASTTQTDFYTGETTTFAATVSKDVNVTEDGGGMGPFEAHLSMEPMCPGGHGPTETAWIAGSSFLRYDYFWVQGPGVYEYNHMLPHPPCPTVCGNSPPLTIIYRSSSFIAPARIRIVEPWLISDYTGLICSPWGPLVKNATTVACFQISSN